jgi:multisubunit Na+/H+ antiporter MnhC subunit
MNDILSFAQNHTVIVIVVVLGLLFFVYRRPKLFFVLLFLGLFLAGVLYMITSIGASSSKEKKRLIYEEKGQSDSIP